MKICGDYTPTVVIEIQLLRRCEKMINNIDDKLVEVLKTGFAGDVDLISPSIYNTLTMQNVVGSTGATADAEMLMVLQATDSRSRLNDDSVHITGHQSLCIKFGDPIFLLTKICRRVNTIK
ncbi:uncharacterized protein PHALS_08560 [Plasmopara halstedii]|uniref:Uncharacterized protein n=1 Tax=Plasmopara halstedii TaxID=4781 RepID=A0A0P1AD59_PLAHL|nr:uncharacterized protein PHALS_08560 [Plasmopara halstedii]CEG38489.1 hypothetical protein PHALS_08560 [Plasmopara halstedii]|eukprot:XP_024574858.1 hypothetical protein PHALS_08560 [Plasmopara halstedii]